MALVSLLPWIAFIVAVLVSSALDLRERGRERAFNPYPMMRTIGGRSRLGGRIRPLRIGSRQPDSAIAAACGSWAARLTVSGTPAASSTRTSQRG